MGRTNGGLTRAQLADYNQKRDRELPEREALSRRYWAADAWLETNFTSLAHWRRYVEAVEAIIATFRAEEAQLPFSRASSFMRELMDGDVALWANQLTMAEVPYRAEEVQ